jgi:hypothetical protein
MSGCNRAKLTDGLLDEVHRALPCADARGVDYITLRQRLHHGPETVRMAVITLVEQKRAETLRGGDRGRKLFRRAARQREAQCGN